MLSSVRVQDSARPGCWRAISAWSIRLRKSLSQSRSTRGSAIDIRCCRRRSQSSKQATHASRSLTAKAPRSRRDKHVCFIAATRLLAAALSSARCEVDLMRFAIATLGCKVNQYDSAMIETRLGARGIERCDFDQPADVYIVN